MTTKGFDHLQKALEQLGSKTATKRCLRKATRAGAAVILKAVKAATPVDENRLRQMMASSITNRGFSFTAIVGADVALLKDAASQDVSSPGHRPSNADWLVNDGHVNADGSFTPPTSFMEYAADVSLPQAERIYEQKLAEEIEKEASK